MIKSKKPIFSDVIVSEMMALKPRELKRVLNNMSNVIKALEKNKIRVLPHSAHNDLDLEEILEKEPNNKDRKLQPDIMFG